MFKTLSDRLSDCFKNWRGQAALTETNVQETLNKVKEALIDSDVSFSVVKQFIENVKIKAMGQKIDPGLKPGEFFIKLVHDELVHLMGEQEAPLDLGRDQPAVILMAGLQGSGKTTTAAKLARYLQETKKKRVALLSTDVYRPAAILQLQRLAEDLGVFFMPSHEGQKPEAILRAALADLKNKHLGFDVLIVDTAGRLHIDEAMMAEIQSLHKVANPSETLFIVDSMTGQDATRAAERFNQDLPLTGIILTKADGDNRGGAALSIRQITGKPIKFLGVGEKTEALESFYPDRMASRILGMGDVLTLIEDIAKKADKEKAEALAKKLKKGQNFDLEDFQDQIKQMIHMGGIGHFLDKMPGMNFLPEAAKNKVNDRKLWEVIYVVDSMNKHERRRPFVINGSRKRRIAAGAGVDIQAVNRVLKQHQQMEKMMKKMQQKGGIGKMMQMLQGKLGAVPTDF